jgi:hypothetical protein
MRQNRVRPSDAGKDAATPSGFATVADPSKDNGLAVGHFA